MHIFKLLPFNNFLLLQYFVIKIKEIKIKKHLNTIMIINNINNRYYKWKQF